MLFLFLHGESICRGVRLSRIRRGSTEASSRCTRTIFRTSTSVGIHSTENILLGEKASAVVTPEFKRRYTTLDFPPPQSRRSRWSLGRWGGEGVIMEGVIESADLTGAAHRRRLGVDRVRFAPYC